MPTISKLPSSLASKVAKSGKTNTGKLFALRERLLRTRKELDEANSELNRLRASNKLLRDNSKIKSAAVRYAKIFMILVPLVCFFLLLSQIFNGIVISWGETTYSFEWQSSVDGIAQTSLIVAPLVFLATVLGFLLRGVFGQSREVGVGELSEFARTLNKSE